MGGSHLSVIGELVGRLREFSGLTAAGRAAPFFVRGDAARARLEWQEAADHYAEGVKRNPSAFSFWLRLGDARREAADMPGAEAAYQAALALRRADCNVHLALARLYDGFGESEKATLHFTEAVHFGANDAEALRRARDECFTSASPSAALLQATELFHRGDVCRDRQLWSAAAAHYTWGLKKEPGAFPFWVQLGHMLKEAGDIDRSEAAYLRALEVRPYDADAHLHIGHLYNCMGETRRAVRHYISALDAGSRDLHALRFLSQHEARDDALRNTLAHMLAPRQLSSERTGPILNVTQFILSNAS